jgi:hypothetical protein
MPSAKASTMPFWQGFCQFRLYRGINYENALGRSDIVMNDRKNRQAIVIEAKHLDAESAIDKDCDATLRQIEERGYAKKLERS